MARTKDLLKKAGKREHRLGFDPLGGSVGRYEPNVLLENIVPDPDQPRKDLGGEEFEELKSSIKQHGVLQPVILNEHDDSRYIILVGERRVAASKDIGNATVPAIIRTVKQQDRLQLQLVENLHRKDLNAFEEAAGYQALKNQHDFQDSQIAERVGKSRPHITKMLTIGRIPESIRKQCSRANISRDDLYNLAKQKTEKAMLEYLDLIKQGVPRDLKRAASATGTTKKTTGQTSNPKPKSKYNTPKQAATVIVQSLTLDDLTPQRQVAALKDALKQAEKRR